MRPDRHAAAVLLALLTACASTPSDPLDRGGTAVDRIVYELGPCRGFCPSFTVSIDADGEGQFVGNAHTRVGGKASFDGSPALFRDVERALAPARPTTAERTISHDGCEPYATDQPQVTVRWERNGRPTSRLTYDLGCRDERLAPVRSALAAARKQLPIDTLVGRSTEF